MKSVSLGTLYVVATPLGNLKDITLRALEILKTVDWIAAEDTRHSSQLLQHYSITTPLISLHDFNEHVRSEKILLLLKEGKSLALISDAGTPLISDPGYILVSIARKNAIPVVPIPGACAAIAALSVSGLPTNLFFFEGFLPAKKSARQKRLKELCHDSFTIVFYESPHRLLETLQDMREILGVSRQAVIARELTKIHETIEAGSLGELHDKMCAHSSLVRGEFVLLVSGKEKADDDQNRAVSIEKIWEVLSQALPTNEAIKLTSKITGERKNKLYQQVLLKKGRID